MTLQTPHSGFQWNGMQYPFFEGWYYRLTLPPNHESYGQTIAFMYSFQAPKSGVGDNKKLGGSAVQILCPDEQYFCRSLPNLCRFWACKDKLAHGYSSDGANRQISEGYEVTVNSHEGQLWNPASAQMIRWSYVVEPVYGWGTPKYPQQSTAGWLSQFKVFEPGWQILMAHGWATGWFEIVDHKGLERTKRLNFEKAPIYAEKNWGGAFPKKWFWVQCNAFEGELDLTLTSGGGIRRVMGWQESVGMVGIHYQGKFYEFVPWNSKVSWQILPWGSWQVWAKTQDFEIELVGKTSELGVMVRVPTTSGLEFFCRDTTRGELTVSLWQVSGQTRQLICRAYSKQAGLEIGGDWTEAWNH